MNEPTDSSAENPASVGEEPANAVAIPPELAPILELMPEEKRGQALILMTRVVSKAYRGPVPDAEEMQKYKDVDSSFPERFVTAFEKEQMHRHEMDKADQSNDFKLKKGGQDRAFAALVFLGIIMLALVFMGAPTIAGIVAGTTIIGVVSIFIAGRFLEYKAEQTDIDG